MSSTKAWRPFPEVRSPARFSVPQVSVEPVQRLPKSRAFADGAASVGFPLPKAPVRTKKRFLTRAILHTCG
jgi:hypothetical protein